MADDGLKKAIEGVLRSGHFKDADDFIAITDGDADNVHVLVISRKLGGKRAREKRDLIWGELIAKLKPDEWGRISLLAAKTPEEAMAE